MSSGKPLLQKIADLLYPAFRLIVRYHEIAYLREQRLLLCQKKAEIQMSKVIMELQSLIKYCKCIHGTSLTPSFIMSLKRLEIIISLMGDYAHPDDMPDHVNERIKQIKQLMSNFEYIWF
jgi:hypothetical protein